MPEEKGDKWELAKTLAVILLPIGAIIGFFYIIFSWLGLAQLRSLWQKIYEDFVKELKEYSEEDNGNLTPAHQTILKKKEDMLQQAQGAYFQAATSLWTNLAKLAELAMYIGFGVLAIYIAPTILKKWAELFKGRAGTAKGMSYIAICSLIDDYAAKGQTLLASRLYTVTSAYFYNVDSPLMQAEIQRYQQIAQTTTGWLYYYAMFMVQYYTLELQAIPMWFAALPPLPPP